MKKRIFTITVIIFAFLANVSAQLKFDANGRVGIGTASPQYRLDVNGDTRVIGGMYLGGSTSNFLGTTDNYAPVRFKVGSVFAGYTGNTGHRNVSFGYGTFFSNTSGDYNTATGFTALYSNTTGLYNTAGGMEALKNSITGNYNTAYGTWALYSNTTGGYNTASGTEALKNSTTGDYNTAYGSGALYSNITGNRNTAVGSWADVTSSNLTNATAVGFDAKTTSSNQVRIGNSNVTSIGGNVQWSILSDKRIKKNIRPDVPGLAFINLLQPVTFNFDLDAIDGLLNINKTERPGEKELSPELVETGRKAREAKEKVIQTGFIAQDVEDIAKSIGYDFSGVDVDETGIYGLRYAEFVVPLVKAVQELGEHNNRLQAQVDELSAIVRQLSGKAGNANDFNGTGGK